LARVAVENFGRALHQLVAGVARRRLPVETGRPEGALTKLFCALREIRPEFLRAGRDLQIVGRRPDLGFDRRDAAAIRYDSYGRPLSL
jgi:hypothetical protein